MGKKTSYIITRLKKGDSHLFEVIYRENYHTLTDYAQHFVFSREDAREIVQNVFLKVWEIRKTLPDDINFKNYLYAAIRNQSIDFLKHRKHKNRYISEKTHQLHAYRPESPGQTDNPLEVLITKEMEEKILSAIDTLPPKCREVFMMNRFEGMKYKEIADKLNLSLKTVESHMYQALKSLKNILGK